MPWINSITLPSRKFTCGYCGNIVASIIGFQHSEWGYLTYSCPNCEKTTFFSNNSRNEQVPGPVIGNKIDNLPVEICALYDQARMCIAVTAFTSAVLSCRKLLMHIGVDQGAPEGESFMTYIEYLSEKGFIPPNGKGWVDQIRKKGNEANHEIILMNYEDALELIVFTEMLLKFIYEFPAKIAPR